MPLPLGPADDAIAGLRIGGRGAGPAGETCGTLVPAGDAPLHMAAAMGAAAMYAGRMCTACGGIMSGLGCACAIERGHMAIEADWAAAAAAAACW
jgi:hypothetical protein